MKQLLLLELIKALQSKHLLKKKLKIFFGVGVVFLFLVGGLVVWGAITATNYVAGLSSSPKVQYGVQNVQDQVMSISLLNNASCWDKAQSLLTLRTWLDKPLAENFNNLKLACMENKQPLCEGSRCDRLKNYLNTAEKEQII